MSNLVTSLRYSATHDGWFWDLWIDNPYPMLMPDGTPSIIDRRIYEGGYAKRKRTAERAIARAERKLRRRVEKAHRLMSDV